MKKTLSALLVAGSAMAIATPALAQDVNNSFTGPRAEVLVGYDQVRAGSTEDNDANDNDDQSIDGVGYGVGVGYDFAAGGALIGVEAEYMGSTAEYGVEDGDREAIPDLGGVNAGRDIYVGARIGALVTPQTLLYVKGGYTNARFDAVSQATGNEFERNIDAEGYRIGAGGEYAIGTNSFIKLEYRYSNYSNAEVDFGDADVADTNNFDVDLDRHQVMAGVGFRF